MCLFRLLFNGYCFDPFCLVFFVKSNFLIANVNVFFCVYLSIRWLSVTDWQKHWQLYRNAEHSSNSWRNVIFAFLTVTASLFDSQFLSFSFVLFPNWNEQIDENGKHNRANQKYPKSTNKHTIEPINVNELGSLECWIEKWFLKRISTDENHW